jgi:hypothetical protein
MFKFDLLLLCGPTKQDLPQGVAAAQCRQYRTIRSMTVNIIVESGCGSMQEDNSLGSMRTNKTRSSAKIIM